jgi:hypothetical protein
MKKQQDKVDSFHLQHMSFMTGLNAALDSLNHDISEAKEIDSICTNEWCLAIEKDIDDLANIIYSISEPRWSCSGHSKKIRGLRTRLHDLYAKYRGATGSVTH